MHTARARLLFAFTVMALAALLLATVGWSGLNNTEQSVEQLRRDILPDISNSLELAERTASLAALAPFVAEASAPFQLQHERKQLEQRIAQLKLLENRIHHTDSEAVLKKLLRSLYQQLNELIRLTNNQLFHREDLQQHLYRLRDMSDQLERQGIVVKPWQHSIDQLIAASSASAGELDFLKHRFQEQIRLIAPATPRQAALLKELQGHAQAIFRLRDEQFNIAQRQTYLLASVRAISSQLSKAVNDFVAGLQHRLDLQRQQMAEAAHQGKLRIVVFSLFALGALGLGSVLVLRLTHSLKSVTRLMTRLANGVAEPDVPAVDRQDEIGSLARAFNVFRENSRELQIITDDLTRQKSLLETVFDNINDGLSVFNGEQRLVTWNPQYLSMFGLPPGEVYQGMPLSKVQALMTQESHINRTLDNQPLDMDAINQLRLARPLRFERFYQDGRVIEFRSQPMPDGGFVTLYSDRTEREAIEAQLRQAQKMEVLGQLTGGIAHDFNNLLAAVIGNLQLLAQQPDLSEKITRYNQRALAASERGANIVHRLLAFSRKQQLFPEARRINDIIEGMLDLIEYSIGPTISLQLELDEQAGSVFVDPSQLENSLLNLALNASAAMPEGGILAFSTYQESRQDDVPWVVIDVSDTGIGIPEELRERVFDPFFTTKEQGEGGGLGLSMVYGFVKQSGGDIEITGGRGGGTCIRIRLPSCREALAAEPADTGGVLATGDNETILVVEDDPLVLDVTKDMLAQLHYQAIGCSSAAEAIELLDVGDLPAAVLSDINLGTGRSGILLEAELRQRWPGLPCLLASGLSQDQLSRQYQLPDDVVFIAKPYRLESLARTLAQCLRAPGKSYENSVD